jgi:hypothetical protein
MPEVLSSQIQNGCFLHASFTHYSKQSENHEYEQYQAATEIRILLGCWSPLTAFFSIIQLFVVNETSNNLIFMSLLCPCQANRDQQAQEEHK